MKITKKSKDYVIFFSYYFPAELFLKIILIKAVD
jgi:hypothetical protein